MSRSVLEAMDINFIFITNMYTKYQSIIYLTHIPSPFDPYPIFIRYSQQIYIYTKE